MGIESDQLVFDYLSRVGDLAQQRQLPSGTRMRLVSELRGEIDRRRTKATLDSPAAVRRILDRIGTPESVVAAANSRTDSGADTGAGTDKAAGTDSAPPKRSAVPAQRAQEPAARPRRLRRTVPRPRAAGPEVAASESTGMVGSPPTPPHLASTEELGTGPQPDWWRVESGPLGATDSVPGFTGGVEIPEMFRPPPVDEPDKLDKSGKTVESEPKSEPTSGAAAEVVEVPAPAGRVRRRFVPRLRPLGGGGGWSNPLLLVAAALLVAGAVIGNLVMLGLGWLIAYLSRRLSPTEAKWAVLVVPGLVASGGIVWIWGRSEGRWGAPIAQDEMSDAIGETWPWVLRGAAVASALYLVWRSQRRK
ncbi:hypothetical protein C6Y14_05425 [Streptomyces dioscori]|uniref:Uncharacterized protein n=1 Tax=Streptomyces dioscori TaxID=2109333 RepID=A0A2P8QDZ4_9ACTN|nr:hypothetical protein [Streptomyces dioscori]PSM44467.1 hypothetical protein C6Y14_05425 [Streptomyces dioscori]